MPGVIGRVGTMFGEAGVNIANMAVSRTKEGGKALMALVDRHARAARARRADPRRGLRRRPVHLAVVRYACAVEAPVAESPGRSPWPGESRTPRGGRRGADRGVRGRHAHRRGRGAGRSAASCGEIVKSLLFDCDGRPVLVLVPGDRRADPKRSRRHRRRGAPAWPAPRRSRTRPGTPPGAVAPFPLRRVERVLIDRSLLAGGVLWVGAGSTAHMAGLPAAELVRVARAEPVDVVATSNILSREKGAPECRRPRRSG